MKTSMIISPQDATRLPLHDATVLALIFPSLENGFDAISIKVKMSSDESRNPVRKLGIEGAEFWLVFEGCWQINANLIGFCSGNEKISSFDLIEPSDLGQRLREHGVPGVENGTHFRIEGSHGSLLEILAHRISMREI